MNSSCNTGFKTRVRHTLLVALITLLVMGTGQADAQEPRKKIVVGSEIGYPPYAIVNDAGKADGFSVDLMKAVCKVMGIEVSHDETTVTVTKPKEALKAVAIKTHEYPGFPTDLQAPMVVLLTQAEGESQVFETIFEGRLHYVEDLIQMGGDIRLLSDRELLIHGPQQLHSKQLRSPDIRAGLAFIIAAAVAVVGDEHLEIDSFFHQSRSFLLSNSPRAFSHTSIKSLSQKLENPSP